MSDAISEDLDRQISMTHERLIRSIEARLPDMGLETKERYFTVLSLLATKVAETDRSLRDVLRDVMAEATGILLRELGQ